MQGEAFSEPPSYRKQNDRKEKRFLNNTKLLTRNTAFLNVLMPNAYIHLNALSSNTMNVFLKKKSPKCV